MTEKPTNSIIGIDIGRTILKTYREQLEKYFPDPKELVPDIIHKIVIGMFYAGTYAKQFSEEQLIESFRDIVIIRRFFLEEIGKNND